VLDWALRTQCANPSSFKDRLQAGDLALFDHDYHGAIVEYLRCLGLKNDQSVRDKLIKCQQLARKADFGSSEPWSEYKIVLEKALKIKQQAFGKNHHQVQIALFELGIANRITNNLTEAEHLLKSIKLGKNDTYPDPADVAYALGDVYSKEGKCDEAVEQYRAGLALETREEIISPSIYVQDRIANAYICAGRFKDAIRPVQRASIHRAPELTGSTSGTIEETGPLIE
jgi:tetratricopeptide (TPR) repeat protein